jgi:hypothetical protein
VNYGGIGAVVNELVVLTIKEVLLMVKGLYEKLVDTTDLTSLKPKQNL